MIRISCLVLLAAVGLPANHSAAWADTPPTKPAALATLESMVSNLGYTTTDATNLQSFGVQWPGKNDTYTVSFIVSTDGSLGYAYIQLDTLTPAQIAKAPSQKILEADDSGDYYYSMEAASDGELLYSNRIIPLVNLTQQGLRGDISSLVADTDADAALWDTANWK